MIKILITGYNGRMGHALRSIIAERDDCTIAAGIDLNTESDGTAPVFSNFEEVNVPVDVVIDFSSPTLTAKAADYCEKNRLPIIVCTTGLSDELIARIDTLSEVIPVFRSANMSMGINLLIELCKKASELLGEKYDIEIVEKHHHNKLDAPSGTALMIADEINAVNDNKYHYVYERQSYKAKRDPNEIGISSIRGGSITGEHDVLFCGPDEVITLQHTAYSRSVFANGAVNAAVFICGKPAGKYSMKDLMQ